jgi:pimeloyl-ACP methyl ester carboxylesterase
MDMDTVTLFLHMGPGLSSYVERKKFSALCPYIDFWDQPYVGDKEDAYSALIQSTADRIHYLFKRNNNQPIRVIAHSFSGLLLTETLNRIGDEISSCVFLATGYAFKNVFPNLLKYLSDNPMTPKPLREEFKKFLSSIKDVDKKVFWDAFQEIVKDPNFMRAYFHKPSVYEVYLSISAGAPLIDHDSFVSVSNGIIDAGPPGPSNYTGEIAIHLGMADPLLDLKQEESSWRTVFPKAKIYSHMQCGHFPHFENPSLSLNKL